jgi:CBS domain-containing protein
MAESIRERMTVNHARSSVSTVMEAARLMRDEVAGLIPVVKGTTIVGTVSDRDTAFHVVAAAARSQDAATIDPQQELGGKTREVVEGIST